MTRIISEVLILLGILFSAAALTSRWIGFTPLNERHPDMDATTLASPARLTVEIGAIGAALLIAGIIGLSLA